MPAVSKKQQKFFGIVRAIQKGEMAPTTPETAKAAADMKKGDVKKFASTKHKGLPEKKKIVEDKQVKKIIKQLRKSVKAHKKQADTLEKKIEEESNPRIPRKKGQPANSKKHSDLYTDENPKGTIHGLGFKNVDTAKASVSKIRNSSRSHAHKIQAAVAMEQRAREMGKSSEAAVYRKYINSMKKKTKEMNEGRKKYKDLTEGMTTDNAFTVILPSRGETDLQKFQTGLTGDGGIDFGQSNVNDSQLTGDGEYTGLSVMGDITTVEDPTGVGPWFRHRDFDFGDTGSKQSMHGGTYATSSAIGVGAIENQIPGYVPASFRGVKLTGNYSGSPAYINQLGFTDDTLGLQGGIYNNTDNEVTRKGYGTALEFPDSGWMATKNIDTSEVDTLKIHARVSNSNISNASDQTEVYYWSGNKPGFKSVSGDTIGGDAGIGNNKPNDGWRPLNQKPDGSFDNSVSTVLIGPNKQANPDNVLQSHSVHIPEWARGKNSRFIIISKGTLSNGTFSMTSIRFQRKNTMSIQVPLGDPEGSNFIRGGIINGKTTTPEERKKRVADILKSSSLYVTGQFGKGFPGQPSVISGDKEFDTQGFKNFKGISKEFTEETSIEEQISFPQMQERIRNAKEKRREQQKKSEKLYMDTKKKGVKFYDKTGSGRIKDGKKIYD
nr:hypothetical protein [uncultured Mediterranean phage uvMED]